MTIKGTLETFNLRELLQMLAFNQKVGTLMLETDGGARSIYVDRGRIAFVTGDAGASDALLRVLRRRELVPPDRLARPLQLHQRTGRFLGDLLEEMGLLEAADRRAACEEAVGERLFDLSLGAITRFEFVEGQALAPNGTEGAPIEPRMVVESVLLDLTRKLDQWAAVQEVVPTLEEFYEPTNLEIDVQGTLEGAELDMGLAERTLQYLDGFRNLAEVGRVSDVDPLTLAQTAATLFGAGALRAVATEDLLLRGEDRLSRGEAESALTLLQRATQRDDAPEEARLRLADAYEALGQKAEAAQALESFSSLAADTPPTAVFDALHRAHALRPEEPGCAARLCDYYLRNRPWLKDRKSMALEALRQLIHTAVTDRRPLDAARRLKEFIANGDAPSEDLLVLSDLFAAGGEPVEAAEAVFRRSEDLIGAGRVAPARELLQRTLQLDPSRGDARNRLHVLEGQDKKRRQRRRVTTFLCLVSLLVLGGVTAWWTYNQEAGRAVSTVREDAETALRTAEMQAAAFVGEFEKRVADAASSAHLEAPLTGDAERLMVEVRKALDGAGGAIYAYASELERYNATDHKEANLIILRHLETRRRTAMQRAENAISDAKKRGRESLAAGERSHAAGLFDQAAQELRAAWNLAFEDEAQRSRAQLLLENVNTYRRSFDEARAGIESARRAGRVVETYRLTVDLLASKLDSDLTRQLMLPVRLESDPPGARVRLGETATDLRTPCVLEYSPFGETELWLQMAGRVPMQTRLPSYDLIARDPVQVRAWTPHVKAVLPEGPRWTVPTTEGPFGAVWAANGLPVLLLADGSAVCTVDAQNGVLGTPMRFRGPHAVRLAGSMPDGSEWRILGHRTLLVRPTTGTPWEAQALGRLEKRPAIASGVVATVDEMGTVHGYEASTGRERWRRSLGSPPAQGPLASRLGFLVTTQGGTAYALNPETGEARTLAAAVGADARALPLGDGALILGSGPQGVQVCAANGQLKPVGPAAPVAGVEAWASAEGVAWAEADGVRWMGVRAEEPVHVTGLGTGIQGLCGSGDGVLYATAEGGTLTAAALADPTTQLWRSTLGGRKVSAPMLLGHSLYVLVDGGLEAIAR